MIEVTIEMKNKVLLMHQCLEIQMRETILQSPTNMPHTLSECVYMDAIFICLTFACRPTSSSMEPLSYHMGVVWHTHSIGRILCKSHLEPFG